MMQVPVGIKILQLLSTKFCCYRINIHSWCKIIIFVLTFFSYTCYHATRKPLSVVKTHFTRNCNNVIPPKDISVNVSNTFWCDWAPFDNGNASVLLGFLDSSFLFAYAFAMFFSGFVADRVSLRYFLAVGMICSGFADYLLGIARVYEIHSLWYFIVIQIFGGIVQTTGWPAVVALMGNWYGKSKRGIILGIWNSHTSVGNILGTVVASSFLDVDWGLSFVVPGIIIIFVGLMDFLFIVESPEDLKTQTNNYEVKLNQRRISGISVQSRKEDFAIGFFGALKIPGVVEFSLCLFFAKLVNYTFLYWLPFYIKASTPLSDSTSSLLSTIFDVGGILGGIMAGAVSDTTGMSASTCALMLIASIPLLSIYNVFGSRFLWLNITLLAITGFFVNGPYALITTAVSAELGTHKSLENNAKALATVTAIIDGTGSIGAAVGPLLAGVVYNLGWNQVFYMLIFSNIMALIMLLRLVKKDYDQYFSKKNEINSQIL